MLAHWAWPPNHNIKSIDWREKLSVALDWRFARCSSIAYHTEDVHGDRFQTSVDIDMPIEDDNRRYEGSPCVSHAEAINCAAWFAMMQLCTEGILETPAEIVQAPPPPVQSEDDTIHTLVQEVRALRAEVAAMKYHCHCVSTPP